VGDAHTQTQVCTLYAVVTVVWLWFGCGMNVVDCGVTVARLWCDCGVTVYVSHLGVVVDGFSIRAHSSGIVAARKLLITEALVGYT